MFHWLNGRRLGYVQSVNVVNVDLPHKGLPQTRCGHIRLNVSFHYCPWPAQPHVDFLLLQCCYCVLNVYYKLPRACTGIDDTQYVMCGRHCTNSEEGAVIQSVGFVSVFLNPPHFMLSRCLEITTTCSCLQIARRGVWNYFLAYPLF